jgi:hypothetical protein
MAHAQRNQLSNTCDYFHKTVAILAIAHLLYPNPILVNRGSDPIESSPSQTPLLHLFR